MTRTTQTLLFLFMTTIVMAGGSKSFTRDRLRVTDRQATPCSGYYHGHHHCSGEAEAELAFWMVMGLAYGGGESVEYMGGRRPGELVLPIFRVDTMFLYDDANRGAYGTALEGGWGLIGARLNYWDHYDVKTNDHVDMLTWHVLYRMMFGEVVEMDLGGGGIEIGGDVKKYGGSGIFGIRVRLDEHLAVEYFRSWHDIEEVDYSEHDVAIRTAFEQFTVKLGYRFLGLPDRDLQGPYIGVGLTF